jgi:ERCC4-type nuclease
MIKVDDREPKYVDEMLKNNGLTPIRVRMDEGDYVFRDLIVERKEFNDFCGSICDGRLKGQVEKMLRWRHKVVCIVGGWDSKISNIHDNSVLGMMTSLVISGISVLFVKDDVDFCFVVKRLVERVKELDERELIDEICL